MNADAIRAGKNAVGLLVLLSLLGGSAAADQSSPDSGDRAARRGTLRRLLATTPGNAAAHVELATLLQAEGAVDQALEQLEDAIRLEPGNLRYGNRYRMLCIQAGAYDRSITLFEALVETHPDVREARIHLAMAYVDKIGTFEKPQVVSQGLLSNKSIQHLNVILEEAPDHWGATFGRGMNYLHWPQRLRRAPLAIADFEACLKIQDAISPDPPKPYFVATYIALGDAYVKNRQFDRARQIWVTGLARFPDTPDLRRRLRLNDNDELEALVNKERGLDVVINTDLSILWE